MDTNDRSGTIRHMITKEILQAILNIIPDGYAVNFDIRGSGCNELTIQHIAFWHNKKKVVIHLADYLNERR